MKIGSIVECINNTNLDLIIPKLVLNTAYVISNIYENRYGVGVDLEGIKAVDTETGREAGYRLNRFRELLLPDDIEEIIKQELQLK